MEPWKDSSSLFSGAWQSELRKAVSRGQKTLDMLSNLIVC